jgi:FKBP-type peptidyl-prolyl cis-trans isomerase 2
MAPKTRGENFAVTRAKLGDRVCVQYLALRENGQAVEHAGGRKGQVLEFTVGSKETLRGISYGVMGMAVGQERRLTLDPKDAYGVVRSNLVKEIPRGRFPSRMDLYVGKRLIQTAADLGHRRRVVILEITPDTVTVDGNHPLAGEVLEVELLLISLDSPET